MTVGSKEKKNYHFFYVGEQWGGGERPRRDQTTRPLLTSHQGEGTEIHTKRQASQHGCLPSFLGDGDKEIKIVRKKYLELGQLEQTKTKISCTGTTSPMTNQPRKDPFHLYSLSRHSPYFQQPAGATPL
jgi:hypothetical protein